MPQNILLVDDNRPFREILAEVFEELGHTVSQAENGKIALDILSAGFPPDYVVTDFNMPTMNGIELATLIRKKLSVPIILCTSDEKAHSLLNGVSDTALVDKTTEGIQKMLWQISSRS